MREGKKIRSQEDNTITLGNRDECHVGQAALCLRMCLACSLTAGFIPAVAKKTLNTYVPSGTGAGDRCGRSLPLAETLIHVPGKATADAASAARVNAAVRPAPTPGHDFRSFPASQ